MLTHTHAHTHTCKYEHTKAPLRLFGLRLSSKLVHTCKVMCSYLNHCSVKKKTLLILINILK